MRLRNNLIILLLAILSGKTTGQLNFNLPSIFSRLSKTSQNIAATPKQDDVTPQIAPPASAVSCSEQETHFELITGTCHRLGPL